MPLVLVLCLDAWSAPPHRALEDNLTRSWAQTRREQIKGVAYELYFELKKGATAFTGKTVLDVQLAHAKRPLNIDLKADTIHSVRVNGVEVKDFKLRKSSFDVPAKYLGVQSRIEVHYASSFSSEANGFQRSVDPEDKGEYLFTDFEPFYAHKLFPCFDQPDIKATYQLTVRAPRDWLIIGNEPVATVEYHADEALSTFPPTKTFSTYLFFLGAGPWKEWKDSYNNIPLTIYARQTLAKHVDHERLFDTTKKGLAFFNEYFGTPYPFSKYGQVFIPEFAWGGMENPGAVALNERNIFRGPVPKTRFSDRNNLLLHEMAHMWFGDLVTMEWWNDLWLNESFATYTATIAQARALDDQSAWQDFFQTKTWGLWQDQLVTTHPIETQVNDVRTAKGNFDGITYAKGASALKQLHFFVGEEGFKAGVQAYFKKYPYQNTRREDFIQEIAESSKVALKDWTQKWLQTAGLNRIKLVPVCSDGRLRSLTLHQTPSVSKTLSPHRTRLGLFEKTAAGLSMYKSQDVVYTTARTLVPELVGVKCPDFIFPNLDDQDYALFSLDSVSLKSAPQALTQLQDPLTRLMVWNVLAQMVRDAELTPQEYLAMAQTGLATESDDMLLAGVIGTHGGVRTSYRFYLTPDQRAQLAPALEKLIWKRITDAERGSSLQMTFFDFYIAVVQTPEGVLGVAEMLKNNAPPRGITLDQDRRWALIGSLARNNHSQATTLIDSEVKRDPSTLGERMAYGFRAAVPELKVKELYWNEFLTKKDLPYSNFNQAAANFHNANFPALSEALVERYFQEIRRIDWQEKESVVDIYFEGLFPRGLCSSALLRRSQSEFRKAKNLSALARRQWLEAQDELARCVRVRAYSARAKPSA